MSEMEVTWFETVEKTDTVKVCDSCGTAESDLPDDSDPFHTVIEDAGVTAEPADPTDNVSRQYVGNSLDGTRMKVWITGTEYDLCPICHGATIGGE